MVRACARVLTPVLQAAEDARATATRPALSSLMAVTTGRLSVIVLPATSAQTVPVFAPALTSVRWTRSAAREMVTKPVKNFPPAVTDGLRR